MMFERFAVPYLRVSTDDKAQNPERQLDVLRAWGEREGVGLLKPEVDEGTSAHKTQALTRPVFIKACDRAVAAGAEAVVFERVDRFSRQRPDVAIWEKVEVQRRYGLALWFGNHSIEFQQTTVGQLSVFFELIQAHQFSVNLSHTVSTGMATKRRSGSKFGRKPKTLRDGERDLIEAWLREHGWPKTTALLNEHRGVHLLTNPTARSRNSISESALKRLWKRLSESESNQNQESPKMQVKTQDKEKEASK